MLQLEAQISPVKPNLYVHVDREAKDHCLNAFLGRKEAESFPIPTTCMPLSCDWVSLSSFTSARPTQPPGHHVPNSALRLRINWAAPDTARLSSFSSPASQSLHLLEEPEAHLTVKRCRASGGQQATSSRR